MDRYRKRRFAKNLDALLTAHCVTRKEAAADARVPYQWLRRAVSEGISRPDKRSKGHLEALARSLGLANVEHFWDRDLYIPPPPSSIKHVADRIGESMREFVLIVGIHDSLLREIRKHIDAVVDDHMWREKKAEEDQERERTIEEARAKSGESGEKLGDRKAMASWNERQERARRDLEERRREMEERARAFREASERVRAVVQTIDLFRREVVERWRSLGLPQVEDVELTAAEVVPLAERHSLRTVREIAPHVSDLWLAKYSQVLGLSPNQAISFIRRETSTAYGTNWERGSADGSGTPSCGSSGDPPEASQVEAASSGFHIVEIGSDAGHSPWWRDGYVPPEPSTIRSDQPEQADAAGPVGGGGQGFLTGGRELPKSTGEKLAALNRLRDEVKQRQSKQSPWKESADSSRQPDPEFARHRPGSPEAISSYLAIARQTLDLLGKLLQHYKDIGLPLVDEVPFDVEVVTDHAEKYALATPDALVGYVAEKVWLPMYARLLGKSPEETTQFIKEHIARQRDEKSLGDQAKAAGAHPERIPSEAEILARAAARPLVARALDLLSSEPWAYFCQGYTTVERAETYLEGELFDRIFGMKIVGNNILPKQTPEEAVQAVIAEIIEDYDKSKHHEDDNDSIYVPDEPIALEEKPLESRHGDVTPGDDVDHWGAPIPVGTALEAEIARSAAEDKEATERHLDDILSPLSELAVPGGNITYLAYFKRFGNPRSVATVALRASDGNVGKALERLVEQVNKSIEDEKSRAEAAKRSATARLEEKATPPAKSSKGKRRSVKVSPEDIQELVLEAHKHGMSVRDIIVDLRNDEAVPEWVRRAKQSVLARQILDIIARSEADGDGEPELDEFNPQAQDDKRAWEMGYGRDPDLDGLADHVPGNAQ